MATETVLVSGVFSPSASYIFTFTDSASFCNAGTYTVAVTVNLPGDINPANNTFTMTIVNDTTVVGGALLSSDTVCISGNSGVLTLAGYTGYPDYWQYSTDGGGIWTNISDTTNSYNYSGLTQTTAYRVHLDGGFCPDGWSPWAVITVDDTTFAGFTVGNATVCATSNSGIINLTGNNGSIIDWESSVDGTNWVSMGGVTSSTIGYSNLTATTFYHAIVQNGVCPPDTAGVVTITVDAPPTAGLVATDTSVCYGSSGTLTLTGFSGSIQYWIATTGSGTSTIIDTDNIYAYGGLTETTSYAVVLQNGICPADTSVGATVTVLPLPIANAGTDVIIDLGQGTCLNASGGVSYSWTPAVMLDFTNIASPCIDTATMVGVFSYTVTVTDAMGCSDNDVVTVTVLDTTPVIIPPKIPNLQVCNFITPNNDSDNDVWNIIDIDMYPDNQVMIMNNHGQILFEQTAYNNTWGGDGLPDGSYYYLVRINALDKIFKGVLTITSSK